MDVIRQCMSVLRKEAQLAQHKPLDRLEEVGGCDTWEGHTGGGALMCGRVTQGEGL